MVMMAGVTVWVAGSYNGRHGAFQQLHIIFGVSEWRRQVEELEVSLWLK